MVRQGGDHCTVLLDDASRPAPLALLHSALKFNVEPGGKIIQRRQESFVVAEGAEFVHHFAEFRFDSLERGVTGFGHLDADASPILFIRDPVQPVFLF